jgi:AcrR family transcriptional regulator
MAPKVSELRWVRPPQQARSRETLDRILDAAEALFSEKGFDDTPVAEVVRRAGSSVGAFYTRFEDKEGLLQALYDRFQAEAMATADASLNPDRWEGASIPEILGVVIRFLVSIYRDRTGLIRALVMRGHVNPEFHARRERLSEHVSERLKALLLARADEIRHPDPERAAVFGLMLVMDAIESALLFGEMRSASLSLEDDELAAELTVAYLAYLGVTAVGEREPQP